MPRELFKNKRDEQLYASIKGSERQKVELSDEALLRVFGLNGDKNNVRVKSYQLYYTQLHKLTDKG